VALLISIRKVFSTVFHIAGNRAGHQALGWEKTGQLIPDRVLKEYNQGTVIAILPLPAYFMFGRLIQ